MKYIKNCFSTYLFSLLIFPFVFFDFLDPSEKLQDNIEFEGDSNRPNQNGLETGPTWSKEKNGLIPDVRE